MFDEDVVADQEEFDDYLSGLTERPADFDEAAFRSELEAEAREAYQAMDPSTASRVAGSEELFVAQQRTMWPTSIQYERDRIAAQQAAYDSTISRLTAFQEEVEAMDIEGQIADKLQEISAEVNVCAYSFVTTIEEIIGQYERFENFSQISTNIFSGGGIGGNPIRAVRAAIDGAKQVGNGTSRASEHSDILGTAPRNTLALLSQYFKYNTAISGFGAGGAGDEFNRVDYFSDRDIGNEGSIAFMENGVYFFPTHGVSEHEEGEDYELDAAAAGAGAGGDRSGTAVTQALPTLGSDYTFQDPQVVLNYYLVLIAVQIYYCNVMKRYLGGQSSAGDFSNTNLGALLYLASTYGQDDYNQDKGWASPDKLWIFYHMQWLNPEPAGDGFDWWNMLRTRSTSYYGPGDAGSAARQTFATAAESNLSATNLLKLSIIRPEGSTGIWGKADEAVELAIAAGTDASIASAARTFIRYGKERTQRLYDALDCIEDAWEGMKDLEDQIVREINAAADRNHIQEGDYNARTLEDYSRRQIERVRNSMADVDGLASVFYARNP